MRQAVLSSGIFRFIVTIFRFLACHEGVGLGEDQRNIVGFQ